MCLTGAASKLERNGRGVALPQGFIELQRNSTIVAFVSSFVTLQKECGDGQTAARSTRASTPRTLRKCRSWPNSRE